MRKSKVLKQVLTFSLLPNLTKNIKTCIKNVIANTLLYLGLLCITLLSACQIIPAEDKVGLETPELITRQYLEGVKKQDWKAVSQLFHEQSLKEFKLSLLPIFINEDSTEYRHSLFGKMTIEEVKEIDSHIFFSVFLNNVFAKKINAKSPEVVGGVAESEDLYHVLIRSGSQPLGNESSHKNWQVISLKPEKNNKQMWRILVGDNLKRHAYVIKMRMLSF